MGYGESLTYAGANRLRQPPAKVRLIILLLAFVVTVGSDQTTKQLARSRLDGIDAIELLGGLGQLRLAENPGSFLSLGALLPETARVGLLTVGVAAGLIGLLVYLVRKRQLSGFAFVALAAVWSGGVSNLIDRVTRHGMVTDFLYLRAGPLHTGVFNIADMVIMGGMGMLLYEFFIKKEPNPDGKPRD